MARMDSPSSIPEEIRSAVVLADGPLDDVVQQSRGRIYSHPYGYAVSGHSTRIAHVMAGDDGVEDVEVSVHCPHCEGEVLVEVANEQALHTAMSLLGVIDFDRGGVDSKRELDGVSRHREVLGLLAGAGVGDAVNRAAPSVTEKETLGALPSKFAESGASSVIVTDDEGRPVGVVTPGQVFDAVAEMASADAGMTTVSEVMQTDIHSLRVDAPLSRAVDLFTGAAAARELVVVGDGGTLVGTLSPADLLRYVASG